MEQKTDTTNQYIPMLLVNSHFEHGKVREFVDSIEDEEIREMALAEYCYFTGDHVKNAEITAKYLEHENFNISASAWFMYSFSNMTLCNQEESRKGIRFLHEMMQMLNDNRLSPDKQAMLVFVVNAANVLTHIQIEDLPPLNKYISLLPPGLRVFGCYVMAHQCYLKGEYEKGLGIVETCLSFSGNDYIIPSIYINIAGAMNAMSLEKVELGKEFFLKAYELAKEDELLEPLGEHHGLLQGLIEICLKKSEKDYYEKIIAITYRFSYGWRRVHNPMTQEQVADTLTTMEFTIAMLANRGWTNNEIADYMGLTINTVKAHIANVFNKLGISSRKELTEFMLR